MCVCVCVCVCALHMMKVNQTVGVWGGLGVKLNVHIQNKH